MARYFVYHNDDYENMGGIDLVPFDTLSAALEFIAERIGKGRDRTLDMYTLIRGAELELVPLETVWKVGVKHG